MRRVELYYDIVCPFAYLASTQIEAIAREAGATVEWKPFLIGGLLREIGPGDNAMATMSEPKRRHNELDMYRWAEHFGVPLEVPAAHPRRTVLALRAILAVAEWGRVEATRGLFRAYWVDGRDVADPAVVSRVLDEQGLDGEGAVARASDDDIKWALRERTDEAVARGVFGAPTFFVDGEMYWGQDRLDFVARALQAA